LAVRSLGLESVRIVCARAESLKDIRFDVILIRLVGPIRNTLRLVEPLLSTAGRIIYYKSVTVPQEIAQVQPLLKRLHLEIQQVRDFQFSRPESFTRRLVVVGRVPGGYS